MGCAVARIAVAFQDEGMAWVELGEREVLARFRYGLFRFDFASFSLHARSFVAVAAEVVCLLRKCCAEALLYIWAKGQIEEMSSCWLLCARAKGQMSYIPGIWDPVWSRGQVRMVNRCRITLEVPSSPHCIGTLNPQHLAPRVVAQPGMGSVIGLLCHCIQVQFLCQTAFVAATILALAGPGRQWSPDNFCAPCSS